MLEFPFNYINKPITENPKISVITPSFNQGQYIEETILSVINQDYPNLEYIIMDGGSSDNTVDVIKKYENKITFWESKKDKGQADAINRGFEMSTGDIICWLNSDDYYLPGSLWYVAQKINTEKEEILYGNCIHFREENTRVFGTDVRNASSILNLSFADYIIQPSSFYTRKAWEKVGKLDEKYTFVFDWDWFVRAENLKVNFIPVNCYLSTYRYHDNHKTSSGKDTRSKECYELLSKFCEKDLLKGVDYMLKKRKIINALRWRIDYFCNSDRIIPFLFPKLKRYDYQKLKTIERAMFI